MKVCVMKIKWFFVCFAVMLCLIAPGLCFTNNDAQASADSIFTRQTIELQNIGNFCDITIDGQSIYLTDSDKKTITNFNTQKNSASTTNTQSLGIPEKICFNYAPSYAYSLSNVNKIVINSTSTQQFSTFFIAQTEYSFTDIIDIAQSSDGTIFVLILGKGEYHLAKKSANDNKFVSVCTLTGITNNAKLFSNLTGDLLFMLCDDVLYDITNGTQNVQTTYNIPTLNNTTSIFIDHKNDLYVLDKNDTLFHCTQSSFESVTIQNTSDIIDFCINPFNKTLYFITQNSFSKCTIDTDFLNSVTTTPSVDITKDKTTNTLKTGNIKTNTFVYTYDNLMQKTTDITKNTSVVILDEMEDGNFYYILCTNNQKNTLGYVLKNEIALTSSIQQATSYETIYQSTPVYAFPTTLYTENTAPLVLTTLEQGSIILTEETTVLPIDKNGANFVATKLNIDNQEYIGYIDTRVLCQKDDEVEIKTLFVDNASTKGETQIFEDNELKNLKTTLSKNARVQIISNNAGVCYVCFKDGDQIVYGYAKYANLNDGSISTIQIIGFFIMLLAVVAILITLKFIKKYKRKFALDYEK